MSKGIKLVILDECDAMTSAAQFALRRSTNLVTKLTNPSYPNVVVEKYIKTTRFCLLCNHVSKIIPALQSRCTRFRFTPLPEEDILGKLQEIAAKESIPVTPEAQRAVIALSGGDMRKVLNILESVGLAHAREEQVGADAVYACTGKPSPEDVRAVVETLLKDGFNDCFARILSIKREKGLAVDDLVKEVHDELMKTELPTQMKLFLVQRLSTIEYRLSLGVNEKTQLASMVGAFVEIRSFVK